MGMQIMFNCSTYSVYIYIYNLIYLYVTLFQFGSDLLDHVNIAVISLVSMYVGSLGHIDLLGMDSTTLPPIPILLPPWPSISSYKLEAELLVLVPAGSSLELLAIAQRVNPHLPLDLKGLVR